MRSIYKFVKNQLKIIK